MENKKVRIGAVGVGNRLSGVLKRLLAEDRALELAAIAEPDAERQRYAKERLNLPELPVKSFQEILEDPTIDWLFIGSPNVYHPEQILAGFKAGKHVFCEKPLATNSEQVKELVRVWKESGRTFAFGLVLRYSQIYQKCHEILKSGILGDIVSLEFNETLSPGHGGYIHGNWRRKREIAGTHLLEKCCHDLDLCLWLVNSYPRRVASFGGLNFFIPKNHHLGEEMRDPKSGESMFQTWRDPQRVNPFGEDKSIVDNQVAIIEFENQVRATFHTNCNAALIERRFYILGTLGTLRVDSRLGLIEYQTIHPGSERVSINMADADGHAGGDQYMARDLAETLLKGTPPAASMKEAVRALVAATAIDKALDEGIIYDLKEEWEDLVESWD